MLGKNRRQASPLNFDTGKTDMKPYHAIPTLGRGLAIVVMPGLEEWQRVFFGG